MLSALLRVAVLCLSVVAYFGAAGVAWTCLQRTCATVFIHNMTLFTSVAVACSTAAASVQLMRWVARRNSVEPRMLLFSALPAVAVIFFLGVSLAILVATAPNKALQPTRAVEPSVQREPMRVGPRG